MKMNLVILIKNTNMKYNMSCATITIPVSIGVFWYVWGVYGFWWGLLYGGFWEVWVGFRLAHYLIGG